MKNAFISSFLFLLFRKGAILARALIFALALLHIWLMWFSKLNLQSISIPNSLSQSLFLICDVPIFTCTFSPQLISKWHLLAFPFDSFSVNHWNRFDDTFSKQFKTSSTISHLNMGYCRLHSLQYHSPLCRKINRICQWWIIMVQVLNFWVLPIGFLATSYMYHIF